MASASSTIHVSGLGQRTIATLKSQAKAEGLSVEGYVKELIESEMSVTEMARRKTIDDVFAPAQRRYRESGMSEEELDRLVDAARTDHHKQVAQRKKR
ncbi:MAG TPA: hypothetical protein VH370_03425 [Humisphaera sp.]|jgi:hypothetical protein|nr:hypothetical protein [Humisphaera sp.]